MGVLGKLKSKAIGLMNKAEEQWYEKKYFGEQYILCDQLTMAVFIRPKVAAKRILHQVREKDTYTSILPSILLVIDGQGRQ